MLDKLMQTSFFKLLEPFCKRYREMILYLLFGGITFFLNIGLFAGISYFTNINELIINIFCWIVCVSFQFITNRTWVFVSHVNSVLEFIKQIISFFSGRLFTLLVEEIILAVFITYLGFCPMIVKLIGQIIVIILNYAISKLIVFKKTED